VSVGRASTKRSSLHESGNSSGDNQEEIDLNLGIKPYNSIEFFTKCPHEGWIHLAGGLQATDGEVDYRFLINLVRCVKCQIGVLKDAKFRISGIEP
jgi:hypothetical protein